MKNITRTKMLSLIVGLISVIGGTIANLGHIWGFGVIGEQIAQTCLAIAGGASVVFFGITVQKVKSDTVFAEDKQENQEKPPAITPQPTQPPRDQLRGFNIDGVIRK